MSQHMESGEDVCPLDHLSQGTPFEDLGAENISGLFCQEAHMDENLKEGREEGCIMWLQWNECGPSEGYNKEQRLERSSFLLIFQHYLFLITTRYVRTCWNWSQKYIKTKTETEDWQKRLIWTYYTLFHTILMYLPTMLSIFIFQSFNLFLYSLFVKHTIDAATKNKSPWINLDRIELFKYKYKTPMHAHCMKLSSFKVKLVRWKLF